MTCGVLVNLDEVRAHGNGGMKLIDREGDSVVRGDPADEAPSWPKSLTCNPTPYGVMSLLVEAT
jgi:hypothetical protein